MKPSRLHPVLGGIGSAALLAALAVPLQAATYNVLWWDSTPDYSGQAPDALRQAMSNYLNAYGGGSVFNSTYVGSETPGTFAAQLSSFSYDVIVFDATSSGPKFNGADLAAVQAHYANNNRNILLDGDLYVRSINYDATTVFPGINSSSGSLLLNEVYSIATRGGGIMVGTDHQGYQVDANQVVTSILPGASFSGITFPSTDGVFYGTDMLSALVPVAPIDIFTHWDSVPTQAIAPTGAFLDYLGASVSLFSQVDVADDPGGGTRFSYISTSWEPGSGTTEVTDTDPGGNAVPEASTVIPMVGFVAFVGGYVLRRRAGARV